MKNLTKIEVDRVIEMAGEDRTPFEAIAFQFNLSEKQVIQLMKSEMTERNWKKWRKRVQGRKTKHQALRDKDINRFKSKMQKKYYRQQNK
jgi:uncharacterized protein (TIGR03643 family)